MSSETFMDTFSMYMTEHKFHTWLWFFFPSPRLFVIPSQTHKIFQSLKKNKQIFAHPSQRKPEAKKLNRTNPSFIVEEVFFSFVDHTDWALGE